MIGTGLLLLLACAGASQQTALHAGDLVVVVLSQGDIYHSRLAQELRDDIQKQASAIGQKAPKVRLTHEEFPHPGAWTVVPLLPKLYEMDGTNSSWIVFCEERTRFNLQQLVSTLSQHDHTEEMWLGHGLHDSEPTIIHHFAFTQSPNRFLYPLLPAGFALSSALLKRLGSTAATINKSDFSIDAMHELAVFVRTALLSLPSTFCSENRSGCAAYPLPFLPCGAAVPNENIFFAVKTCLTHHSDRVPVVQKTWAKDASNIEFFSDVQDDSIPTTAVGVANTVRGHCAKTLAILKLAAERVQQMPNLQWLVLVDDDTLLSVSRLQSLLSCWAEQAVVVGERYGYNVHSPLGYNYPTGGGGMAISATLLPKLVSDCRCQAADSPDDMHLGFCLARLAVPLVHSPFFHQARPVDYAPGYLATQLPVSFHKHWMLDPVVTYNEWFSSAKATHLHPEL
uniref:Fringe-like glycosyltransferase domain-containing protein n=1 Tax=Homalodisca liturata TaxID=320908 RepID=A0A1B6JMB4_9HEMI